MREAVPGFSVLSDISANMFAAFVLVLLLAAAFAQSRTPPRSASTPGAASIGELELTSRTASAPNVMVQILFDRRPWAAGVSIDLMQSRLTVTLAHLGEGRSEQRGGHSGRHPRRRSALPDSTLRLLERAILSSGYDAGPARRIPRNLGPGRSEKQRRIRLVR
jgi:hypothetical protein